MKRTIDDVNLICSSNMGFDPSPYKAVNRDKKINVHAIKLEKGVGAFYDCVPGDKPHSYEPEGLPISYIASLNAVKSIKGFDMSDCEWMLIDEFIPQAGEVVKHDEGEMMLDVYMTVSRDRQKRGKPPLKLILFANAERISTPITNTLEIIDAMADLQASGKTHSYDADRGILLHHITEEEIPIQEAEKEGVFSAMEGTAWAAKSFGGEFANNDFSNVNKTSLKGMSPFIHLKYKQSDIYIYQRRADGLMYFCSSPGKCLYEYNLNKDNDQKLFWREHYSELRNECMEGNIRFQKYSYYDLLENYKKLFRL